MISVFVTALFLIIILEVLISWIKYLSDNAPNDGYYDLCDGCNSGFCMEDPGSEECERIRKETKK